MAEGLDELRGVVAALQARLLQLERRVADLERRPRRAAQPADEPAAAPAMPALPQGGLALAGRTLIVLAGAYLVRALTDGGALPALLGAGLGLGYAALWQLHADRDARVGARTSALVHGLAASVVGFPLLWEAGSRLGLLRPAAAGAAVVGFAALGLLVALRRQLAAHAWLTTLAACATLLALLGSTKQAVAVLAALVGLAALVEWLAFRDTWLGLRWCVAATLDLVALVAIVIGTRPEPPAAYARFSAADAAAALVALSVLYVVSIAARTVRRGFPVRLFEVVQGTLAIALGLFGSRRVLAAHGEATLLPALFAVLLGALCYAVAFAHAERRAGQGRNFYFYSSAGGLLMLGGTLELRLGAALPLVWTALGLAAVVFGRRFGRTTLRVHGALYVAAAAAGAGLAAAGLRALAGIAGAAPSHLAWGTALGAGAAWAVLADERPASRQGLPAGTRLSRLVLAIVVALSLAEAARLGLGSVLPATLGADAFVQAIARSTVLAGLVLGVTWLARRSQAELAGLAYALLALGGVALLLRDLPARRPATLVASFGLYGALLILVPRLLRRADAPADAVAASLASPSPPFAAPAGPAPAARPPSQR